MNLQPMGVAGLTDIASNVRESGTSRTSCLALFLRSVGALGVVYGDIGTSPLYTLSSMYEADEVPRKADLIGGASCLFWALTCVVVFKYILVVLRADHDGEGGIFALLLNIPRPTHWILSVISVLGASLLIGDGMVTPAMSVLSAFEGLDSGALQGCGIKPFIIPLTIFCLVALFSIQPMGIGRIGRVFGPVMVIYFLTVGAIGFNNIYLTGNWEVFQAINPWWVVQYFFTGQFQGSKAFWKLGSVVLSVTGAEALFADLGHFGRTPIVLSWFCLVYPALILGYLGQAAFLISHPDLVTTAFWASVPHSIYYPMLVLVTVATIIASQSLIAGCFSLIDQAVILNFCPRVKTVHTDVTNRGQIFIPEVTVILGAGTVLMVLGFQTSAAMAGAYGMAVTGTFSMTSMLLFAVLRRAWGWPLWKSLLVVVPMLLLDVTFLIANCPKFLAGGWVPVAVAMVISCLMLTWYWGQTRVLAAISRVVRCSTPSEPRQPMEVAGICMLDAPLDQETLRAACAGETDSSAICPALRHLAQSTGSRPRLCMMGAVDFDRDEPHVCDEHVVVCTSLTTQAEAERNMETHYVRLRVGWADSLAALNVDALLERELQAIATRKGMNLGEGRGELPVRYFLGRYRYRFPDSRGPPVKMLLAVFRFMNTCCTDIVNFLGLPLSKVFLLGGVMEL